MFNLFIYGIACRHDGKLGGISASATDNSNQPNVPTQQFGVTLQFVKQNYCVVIPPVVRQCVEYLDKPDGKLVTIFRSCFSR